MTQLCQKSPQSCIKFRARSKTLAIWPAWPAYKGEGGGKLNASAKRDESAKRDRWALVGNAYHDAIVFFVFYVHQRDAKILIGQN